MSFFLYAVGALILVLVLLRQVRVRPVPAEVDRGRVVYAVADLSAWADIGTRTSTSDPGAGTVLV